MPLLSQRRAAIRLREATGRSIEWCEADDAENAGREAP